MVNILKRMVARYEADVGNFEKGLRDAGRTHDAFTDKVKRGADDARRSTEQMGDAALGMREKFSQFSGAATRHIGVVVTATNHMRAAMAGAATITSGALVVALITLADAAQQVENQLNGIGAASEEARKKVYALAIETRTPLESTVGLLRNIQKSLTEQDFDKTLRQVGTLNRLLTIGGLDATRRSSVMLQFGQALQSGVLQGDELRSLRESAPIELLRAIAEQAGGTMQNLRQMGTEGKLTTQVMIDALESLEATARDKFSRFDMTVTDSLTVFRTALIGSIREIDLATGATDALARVIQGAAVFLQDHASAIATVTQAMGMLVQVAVIAAGSRGLAMVGTAAAAATSNVRTLATSFVTLNNGVAISLSAAAAMQALQRGLGTVVAMLGGPWGVAIAAASIAMIAMAKATKEAGERLDETEKNLKNYSENIERYRNAQESLESDRNRLLELSKEMIRSIQEQGSAARAAADTEVAAINARIAKNNELLGVYRALGAEDLTRARRQLMLAEREMENRARMAQGVVGGGMAMLRGERLTEGYINDITAKSQSGQRLNRNELEALELYARIRSLREETRRAEVEFAESAPGMANSHVLAWKKQQEAAQAAAEIEEKALSDLNKAYDDRMAKLNKLTLQREEAERRVSTAGTESERLDALRAVASADTQIAELRDVEGRVVAAQEKVNELNAAMAQTGGMLDTDGRLRALLDEIETALAEAVRQGKNLDEVELTRLEGAINGATTAARRLNIELRQAGETDFDTLRTRMQDGALPYAADVANARNPDYYASSYAATRQAGTGSRDEILVRETVRAANELGIAAQDLLAVIMLESGGSTSIRGGKNNRHIGLIQFGDEEQRRYGANQQQSIPEQMDAVIRYMKDRGVKPGMPIENVYAAVNAGRAHLTSRGDTAAGGIVGNIREFTTGPQMEPYNARAQGLMQTYAPEVYEWEKEYDEAEKARKEAERDRERDEKRRAERQKQYLDSLTDENELTMLKLSLNGKSSTEQDYILRVHQKISEAIAEGLNLESKYLNTNLTLREALVQQVQREMQAEAELSATREAERLRQEEHEKNLQKEKDRLNERIEFQMSMQEGINGLIAKSVARTGDWREMAGRLIEQLAEAYLYAGLFNSGPLRRENGGDGLIGGFTSALSKWVTGQFADGGIMTERGPVPLMRYASGGIARSPQLALFGEGRGPEAYVPLPDGRTIPVTIKVPDVPSMKGITNAGAQTLHLSLDLNNELLQARIVETSTPVSVSITRRGLEDFESNQMPSKVRAINSDPKRVNY